MTWLLLCGCFVLLADKDIYQRLSFKLCFFVFMMTRVLQNADEMNPGKGSISLPVGFIYLGSVFCMLFVCFKNVNSKPLNYSLWAHKQPRNKNPANQWGSSALVWEAASRDSPEFGVWFLFSPSQYFVNWIQLFLMIQFTLHYLGNAGVFHVAQLWGSLYQIEQQ